MTQSRSSQVDVSVTPYYHCISRCVRRAFLCGDDSYSGRNFDHRKQWLVQRLELLAEVFAIDVCAFAVMSNHVHLVLRIDPERAGGWTDEEVAERYGRLFRLAKVRWDQLDTATRAKEAALWRERLVDLSWMMRSLNEWVARQANREDGCSGRFWEGRFKSQALLDERALLTCMAYVDLNPVRAGLASCLQEADFTSIQVRLWQAANLRREEKHSAEKRGAEKHSGEEHGGEKHGGEQASAEREMASTEKKAAEQDPRAAWALMPFADQPQSAEQTVIPMRFADYVALVEWTAGAVRKRCLAGHAADARAADEPSALTRLGLHPSVWLHAMGGHRLGHLTALGRAPALQALATHRGKRWVKGQRWARAVESRVA